MTEIHQYQLPNGLWLVAEPIAGARSLAMSLTLPAGVAHEPEDQQGVATLLSEIICRGAGDLDAKAHCDALDLLGVQRGTAVRTTHLQLGASMIGDKLDDALPLLLDMVRRPLLEDAALPPSRDLALQALDALEDEPQQKVFYELRGRHYPSPFSRSPLGKREHLETIQPDHLRDYHRASFVPGGAILGFAGCFDWDHLKGRIEELLGDWEGQAEDPEPTGSCPRGYVHVPADTAQVHIGLAYDAVPETDDRSMLQRIGIEALSGGMSARLFTEVREKRGLCYAVYASYAAHKKLGSVLSYAGTTAARAQETLDVLTAEHHRIGDGIDSDEHQRAVVGMKSRLVMQGESTAARADAIAADQYIFGQPRTLDEVAAEVEAATLNRVNEFINANRAGAMTTVTIGPDALQVPEPDSVANIDAPVP